MGRPLNKKYFGNRNIGSTGTGDNYGIGGEGIASINWSTVGAFMGTAGVDAITIPALPAPTLPSGVQATWTMEFEVESVTTGAGVLDLAVGDTFAWDPSGADPIPGMVAKVTDVSGANAIFSVTVSGASRGNSMTLPNIPDDTQGVTLNKTNVGGGTATTFLVDIFWRVKASTVTITEKGSGYVGTETFTFTKAGSTAGTVPAGTIVVTTDSGSAGSSTNQENAIVAYAYIPASGQPGYISGTGGSSAVVSDIRKQKNDRRYVVKNAQGVGVCQLVTDGAANAQGEMTIKATDQAGKTYYVAKLTSRKAVLVPYGANGHQFPLNSDGTAKTVKWTFGAAVAPVNGTEAGVVTIENA